MPARRLIGLAAALVLLGGAACSPATSSSPSESPPAVVRGAAQSAPAPASPPQAPAAAPAAQSNPASSAASQGSTGASQADQPSGAAGASDQAAGATSQLLDRMVIRTAQLQVQVQDIEHALAQARQIAQQGGGYVSASTTHAESADHPERTVADLTLQVRSDAADSTISQLRALGTVLSESTGSQDVTDEYVDLDANLRNLQASETAILKLMDRATQMQDILSLQRELSNVRGQIERIQGRKTYLERRTDMATISLALRLPPLPSSSTLGSGWDPLAVANRGWQASLTVLRALAEGLIVAITFGWWLLPLPALLILLRRQRRRPTPA